MQIIKNKYKDSLSKIKYRLQSDINITKGKVYLLKGENGIGKSRFIEGVLLKELKKSKIKTLYFSQDIENQILSFELISLVKSFIFHLKKQGTFFKTVLFNDDSHRSIELDFDSKKVLTPDNSTINNFIRKETRRYKDIEVVVFDEVDKYFDTQDDFTGFLESLSSECIFIISHILDDKNDTLDCSTLNLGRNNEEVVVEYLKN